MERTPIGKTICPECQATGEKDHELCATCSGTGFVAVYAEPGERRLEEGFEASGEGEKG